MTGRSDGGTALVTGASGGIGHAVARQLAARGFDLVVVARRRSELEQLADACRRDHGVAVTVMPADLLAPAAPRQLVDALGGRPIDVLVNNAGLLELGRVAEIDVERLERMVQLNVEVLASLSRRILTGMIERGRGHILNVASTSAFQPVPGLSLYAASKAFVLSFSESLSEELKGTGVTVTALCPGFTDTDMLEVVDVPRFLVSDPEEVARAGVDACLAGQVVVVPGLSNRLGASLVQLYPRWLVRAVGGLIGRRAT
jgi:short-subunit dehydrogenase